MSWIDARERLPPFNKVVLLATPGSHRGDVDVGFCNFEDEVYKVQSMAGWDDVTHYGGKVTHWMPFPEPPSSAPSAGVSHG